MCGSGLVAKSCPALATLWTLALLAALSMGFLRQEYWSGLIYMGVYIYTYIHTSEAHIYGLPLWLSGKESACNAGDAGLISESGRCPRGRYGNPLQYSSLENPMYRGA